jgi:hypothetical protein
MDNSPPDAETPPGNGPYVLMTFTVGDQVDALGPNPTDAQITKAVTDALVFLFDDPRAAEFSEIKIHRWVPSDPFVGGGPNTVFSPGLLSGEAGKLLNEPWGDKIFFASSENTRTLHPSSPSRTWHLLPPQRLPKYDAHGVRDKSVPPPYRTNYSDRRRSLGYMDGALESGRYGANVVAKSLGLKYDPALDADGSEVAAPASERPPLAIPDAAAAAALLRSVHDRLHAAAAAPGGVPAGASALHTAIAGAIVDAGHAAADDRPGILAHLKNFAAAILGHASATEVADSNREHTDSIKATIASLEAKITKAL